MNGFLYNNHHMHGGVFKSADLALAIKSLKVVYSGKDILEVEWRHGL